MTWNRTTLTIAAFGLGLGLWLGSFLAALHPLAPFVLAYLVFGPVLWSVASLPKKADQ